MSFDHLSDIYEALIDWPKRLAAEEPFFRNQFDAVNARKVADVACGSGQHADLFHRMGLQVEACDISPNMIQRAQRSFGTGPKLRWTVRGFGQPPPGAGDLDAVVCVGNSLALAGDLPSAQHALATMVQAVRPGGVVIVQVLNLWKLADGPCWWQKSIRLNLPSGPALIVKGVHRCGNGGFVDLVIVPDQGPLQGHSMRFLSLRPDDLQTAIGQKADIQFYGNHKLAVYDEQTSPDLIMVAHRRV
ncbi:MAG: class I SAM-dependent methyltransferase [Phycisphaerales bacterium]|nr:class I SAM-dependent methyltransferase [Phycisphaerales bacterium]